MRFYLDTMDNAMDQDFWESTMTQLGKKNRTEGAASTTDCTPTSTRAEFNPLDTSSPKTGTVRATGMSRLQKLKALDLRLNLSSEQLKLQKNCAFRSPVSAGGCDDVKKNLGPLFYSDDEDNHFADDECSESLKIDSDVSSGSVLNSSMETVSSQSIVNDGSESGSEIKIEDVSETSDVAVDECEEKKEMVDEKKKKMEEGAGVTTRAASRASEISGSLDSTLFSWFLYRSA